MSDAKCGGVMKYSPRVEVDVEVVVVASVQSSKEKKNKSFIGWRVVN